ARNSRRSHREHEPDEAFTGTATGYRPSQHRYDSNASNRWSAKSELRPPGRADGAGAGGVCALAKLSALRPGRSAVAESRSIRAFEWARIDVVVRDFASDGRAPRGSRWEDHGQARCIARRSQIVPAVGQRDAGTSGVAHDDGRRNDDRTAGTRRWQ